MKQFFNNNILIAGCTGSGKSNFLHKLITSLIENNNPDDLKLFLIDPKRVEFSTYKDTAIVIYRSEDAKNVFKQISDEFLKCSKDKPKTLIVVDEFSDLMAYDQEFFEDCIEKLTKSSNETDIYLILSTSRPSPKDVYTDKIINCFGTKVCFRVGSDQDSLLMIGEKGAEKLTEIGSCLIKDSLSQTTKKFEVPYINYEEIEKIIKTQNEKPIS